MERLMRLGLPPAFVPYRRYSGHAPLRRDVPLLPRLGHYLRTRISVLVRQLRFFGRTFRGVFRVWHTSLLWVRCRLSGPSSSATPRQRNDFRHRSGVKIQSHIRRRLERLGNGSSVYYTTGQEAELTSIQSTTSFALSVCNKNCSPSTRTRTTLRFLT